MKIIFLIKPFWYITKIWRQKLKNVENKKSFWYEIRNIFHNFCRACRCQKLSQACAFNVSWKLCLNLCSRKWSTRTLTISLIPLLFSQLKTLMGVGLTNFRILFLKALKRSTFRMLWSRISPVKRQKKKKKDKVILLNDVLWLTCIRMNHKFILLYVTCINYCKDLNSDNLTLWYGLLH